MNRSLSAVLVPRLGRGPERAGSTDGARLARVYVIEALAAVAANLLTLGIFFFTSVRFGWSLWQNLMLSAAMGALYTLSALSAHPLTQRFGRIGPLTACFVVMSVATLVAAAIPTPLVVTIVLLIDITLGTVCWPILENLVCAGQIPPQELSRRLSIYNLVWAGISVAIVAVNGLIIEHWPAGVFVVSVLASGLAGLIAWFGGVDVSAAGDSSELSSGRHADPEPQLLRQRLTALWLARVSVPAMYVVTFALAAMMPLLPLVQSYRPAMQTVLCSVWLAVRWVAFLALGATTFWHTRPRLLLGAAAALLVAFVLITVRPSELLPGMTAGAEVIDLAGLILGQVLLGITTGLIYMASLYFGMVLTEGSARSGGYHEAMIGIGMTLGPATALATQALWPGQQRPAVAAVASLIAASIVLANIAALHLRRRQG
ncbi:hypothetical protein [Fontivita pretiosa]|uniref:hypothetical protein n=1 Tax=Fontivita pretiosa TaxID=2989684 RepID=UPI003D17CA28